MLRARGLGLGLGLGSGADLLAEAMHGEAHHVVVTAVDLPDEGTGKALDAVAARLVRVRVTA